MGAEKWKDFCDENMKNENKFKHSQNKLWDAFNDVGVPVVMHGEKPFYGWFFSFENHKFEENTLGVDL